MIGMIELFALCCWSFPSRCGSYRTFSSGGHSLLCHYILWICDFIVSMCLSCRSKHNMLLVYLWVFLLRILHIDVWWVWSTHWRQTYYHNMLVSIRSIFLWSWVYVFQALKYFIFILIFSFSLIAANCWCHERSVFEWPGSVRVRQSKASGNCASTRHDWPVHWSSSPAASSLPFLVAVGFCTVYCIVNMTQHVVAPRLSANF